MKENYLISAIIPCLNEENYIGRCLDSVIEQDYPKEKTEILVVDGMSKDKTREIVAGYAKKHSFIKLLDNPNRFIPYGLNIGLKKAGGKIIIIMEAHATYEKQYISKSLKYLDEYGADNVGGIIKTIPKENNIVAQAIALSLSSSFGAGGSFFRLGLKKLKLVDTVFGGCYRKEVFDRIGLYDERMLRSQDLEFNLRLKKSGGKVLLVPSIVAYYYPQANLKNFFEHNFIDGFWVSYPLKFGKAVFSLRHLTPFLFISGLFFLIILLFFFRFFIWLLLSLIIFYLLISVYFSIKISTKEKDIRFLFISPLVFATRHIGYGLGSAWGLVKLLFPAKK